MKHAQLAIQLYTLRDHCKTSADFALTCQKVRAIGYPAVQLSGLGPIPEEEIVKILAGEGLVACATHEPGDLIRQETERVIERLQKLGVRYTAYPYPGGVDFTNMAHVDLLVADLEAAGAKMAAAGLVLAYHNHGVEFAKLPNGQTALEYIYARTSPSHLVGELDTYWVQYGGADPVTWCQKLTGRLPLLHLKDYGFCAKENKHIIAEIGQGNLDWLRILPAAEDSGCQWYIVEQDTCPGDPFDSIKISYEYLTERFFKP
jgi:sugar phosphate isomerase/epimerase